MDLLHARRKKVARTLVLRAFSVAIYKVIYLFIYLKSKTKGPEGHINCLKYTKIRKKHTKEQRQNRNKTD